MNIPNYVHESHKPFWEPFRNWCNNNGIGPHPDDLKTWWDCFIAGATTMYLKFKDGSVT